MQSKDGLSDKEQMPEVNGVPEALRVAEEIDKMQQTIPTDSGKNNSNGLHINDVTFVNFKG